LGLLFERKKINDVLFLNNKLELLYFYRQNVQLYRQVCEQIRQIPHSCLQKCLCQQKWTLQPIQIQGIPRPQKHAQVQIPIPFFPLINN